ncbi:YheC/YheD family protein [Paenibacillus koleovorans]|uniref:YheC/YheD family protein n=1 Tax=Paenibacillus koleovorans TaxID=121608 RepID=UPI0013E3F2E3|nr:YheC/YheD family protein [Paenibacillus koleovorans]
MRTIRSKWVKTKVLLAKASLSAYVPNTKRLTRDNLRQMLERYRMVYVKPDGGTGGNGVMRVEQRAGSYSYQIGTRRRVFATYPALYKSLITMTRGKAYLAQKGIELMKCSGRRFDLRIMVQINSAGRWETTGIVARLAAPKKIVTNYHNGGTPVSTDWLFGRIMPDAQRTALFAKLKALGVATGVCMGKRFPGVNEVGVDVGLDGSRKPWIIEVNTRPDLYIFNQLKDKRMFRKMWGYAKKLGRFKRRKSTAGQ